MLLSILLFSLLFAWPGIALASGADAGASAHHSKDLFSLTGLFELRTLASLAVLTILEVVFGVDNVIYQSIAINKLKDPVQRKRANFLGLTLGAVARIALLAIAGVAATKMSQTLFGFTDPFEHSSHEVSISGLVLIGGGLFLVVQAIRHMFHAVEVKDAASDGEATPGASFWSVLRSIIWINVIFSLDSVFTALGTADSFYVMVLAIVISILVMAFASMPIAAFIKKHPSFNVLALAFLVLIGFHLTAEGLDYHVPKFLVYGMLGFALLVELLQLRQSQNLKKVKAGSAH